MASSTPADEGHCHDESCDHVKVVRIDNRGQTTHVCLPIAELAEHFDVLPESNLSSRTTASIYRDMKIFTQYQLFSDFYAVDDHADGAGFPKILPRPGADFYLLDLFFLKIFCRNDYCFVLDSKSETSAGAMYIKRFVDALVDNLASGTVSSPGFASEAALSAVMRQRNQKLLAFELMVLDTALDVIERSFWSQFTVVDKVLRQILEDCQQSPSEKMSRILLAFKKSVVVLANRIDSFEQAINKLLLKDSDMVDLFLSHPEPTRNHHEEVELILEGYKDGLLNLHLKINGHLVQISDTTESINTHLDHTRNNIIKMSLCMDICMLGVNCANMITGIFGMNLRNQMEDILVAFQGATAGVVLFAVTVIACLFYYLWDLTSAKERHKNYHVLRNFMVYVDDIVGKLRSPDVNSMTPPEFETFLKKLVGKEGISNYTEETDLLFRIFDNKLTGRIDPNVVQSLTTSEVSKHRGRRNFFRGKKMFGHSPTNKKN